MTRDIDSAWRFAKATPPAAGGMVVARHPLAAAAGRAVLKQGGNAVDAVAAASLAGSVVQPVANTIGGGGFLVLHDPVAGAQAINYHYRAPGRSRADMYPLDADARPGLFGWSGVTGRANEIGGLAVAVPGSIAGLSLAVERFGRLPWAKVVEPALALARDGFEVDWYATLMQALHLEELQRFERTAACFLRDGRLPFRAASIDAADRHRQPALADLLAAIARDGRDAFYRGPAAAALAEAVAGAGGLLEAADLAAFQPDCAPAESVLYRGYRVAAERGCIGFLASFLQALSRFDLSRFADPLAPERLDILARLLAHCWHERLRYGGDVAAVAGPWAGMRSPDYAAALAAGVAASLGRPPEQRGPDPADFDATAPAALQGGTNLGAAGNTVHISAADGQGGLASLTETILGNYGSFVTTATGVLLNNGMMAFSPVGGVPNAIAPGKRPLSNMAPLIVYDPAGRPWMAVGASGGRKILSAVLQILSYVIDHGLPLQDAVAMPRLDAVGGELLLDARMGETVAADLRRLGHRVSLREEGPATFHFGNPCGIVRATDGSLHAGLNPFQMTAAAGF